MAALRLNINYVEINFQFHEPHFPTVRKSLTSFVEILGDFAPFSPQKCERLLWNAPFGHTLIVQNQANL